MNMAQTIFGDGVTVVSASYSGDSRSSGIYREGDSVAGIATPADQGIILSTGRVTDYTNQWGSSNHSNSTSTNTRGVNNDADFNNLAGASTYDAAILDIDFIPTTDTLSMQFVFSSEEFPEFINSIYTDLIGVWVNGVPVDVAIGGSTDTDQINPTQNINLYNDNTLDQVNTEMDGFTVTLTLKFTVNPGDVNSIRIGIADVGDSYYDSNLLIAANSVQGNLIATDDVVDVYVGGTTTVDLVANDVGPGNTTLFITHINGIEVAAGDTITLATGQTITLNADGTVTVVADADEETVNFTYTVATGGGSSNITDTAFVTLNSIPCFVAGTLIATPDGEVPVESLNPGDLVVTHDNGPQPLRWIGSRVVPAQANFAPICIAADTFGQHRELLVSPQHRVLIRDGLAELLFGETEVLVAAKDLVNDRSVRAIEGGEVEYVHILFDEHQVVFSEGLATESFLPGPQTKDSFEAEIVEEICALFPEIDPETGSGYSAAARRTLRAFEARVLLSSGVAA